MDLKLSNKTVFITGSTAGIGFAIARRFLTEGAQVTINGRTKESVKNAIDELMKSVSDAKISGIPADFSKADEGSNVTVNSILPGPTKSKGVGAFMEDISKANKISIDEFEKDFFKNMRPTSLLQRFTSVDEIADTVVYYSSPLASATNGASIRVEGGLVKSIL
jgi:NAD(P)-dependent dehydrogenase (short-subunit alcohol dehydrogenase family)